MYSCAEKDNRNTSRDNTETVTRKINDFITPSVVRDTVNLNSVESSTWLSYHNQEIAVKDFRKPIIELIDLNTRTEVKKTIEFKQGRGPGEFTQMYEFYRAGNRIYLTDMGSFKVLIFDYPNLDLLNEHILEHRPSEVAVIDSTVIVSLTGSEYRFCTIKSDTIKYFKYSDEDSEAYSLNPFKNSGAFLFTSSHNKQNKTSNYKFVRASLYSNELYDVELKNGIAYSKPIRSVGYVKEESVKLSVKGKSKLFQNYSPILSIFHQTEEGVCSFVRDREKKTAFIDIYDADLNYQYSYEITGFSSIPKEAIIVFNTVFIVTNEGFLLTGELL
jgi:hypothetical protein